MKNLRLLLVVLLLIVAACGDDEAGTTTTIAPSTTDAVSTTTAPATTFPPTTSTTSPPPTTAPAEPYATDVFGFFPDPVGEADEGHGSGCVLDRDIIANGIWFGYVEAIGAGTVTFDLACFFTGDAAVAAAAVDGEEAFDFYIRNQNPKTFAVPLSAVGSAYWIDATGDLTPNEIPMTDWPVASPPSYQECPGEFCTVWLYVNGGMATELVEQYLP